MKNLKFLILPLLFCLVLFSCGDSNSNEVPPVDPDPEPIPELPEELPVPLEPSEPFQYLTIADLSLSANYGVSDENDNIVLDVKHSIADVQTLVYIVHRKIDGAVVDKRVFGYERLQTEIKDNVFSVGKYLLAGEYYISVVAMMNEGITSGGYAFMRELDQNYNEAVVQIYNAYTYYGTMEIEVKADEGASNRAAMQLKKMTTDLVFEFPNANNLKDKHVLTMGIENIPSAFHLATGITLTDKEMSDRELRRYREERVFQLPHENTLEPLITQFHTLANNNLANSATERGRYWYKFEEKAKDGNILLKSESKTVGECTPTTLFGLYTEDLFSPSTLD